MAPYRALVSSFLRFSISSYASPLRSPVFPYVHTSVAGVRTEAAPKLVVTAAPKRPLTAYMQFVKEKMPEYTKRSPGIKLTAHVKTIAHEWNGLDEAKKKPYQEHFQTEMKKYKETELQWKKSLTPAQLDAIHQAKHDAKVERSQRKARRAKNKLNAELHKLGKPKKHRTAFNIFVMEKVKPGGQTFRAQRTQFGGRLLSWLRRGSRADSEKPINLQQVLIEAGREWRKLTPEEKEPYFIIQAKDIERYNKEMEAWKKRMEEEGFGELVASPKRRLTKKKASIFQHEADAAPATAKMKTAPKQNKEKSRKHTEHEE